MSLAKRASPLSPFIFLMLLLAVIARTPSAEAASDKAVIPTDLQNLADGIKSEKSRVMRLELFTALTAEVKKRVGDLSDNISESEIGKVQTLYELNLLFGSVKTETLNPASCGEAQRSVSNWSNPTRAAESELSSTSRFVVDVVRATCAP